MPFPVSTLHVGRGRRFSSLVMACLVAVVIAAHPALAGATPVSAMNGWSLHGLSSSDLNAQLAQMQSEGVSELRVDASWGSLQPSAPGAGGPTYNWGSEDAEVAALAAHDIRWLPIIDYSAPWAASTAGDWRSPPADDGQYAAFGAAVAARYGAGGTFWAQHPQLPYEPVNTYEIWNEENATYFWDSGPDPAAYARLYLAARSAIHGVQPQASVMIGGLTNPQQGMSALQFLYQMFTAEPSLATHLDAVGVHPYAANAAGVVSFVVQVRQLLTSFGAGAVPIDATEFGWQTGSAAVEQQRASMMSAVAAQLGNSNCGIGVLAPYDWMDPSYITGGDWGLAGADGVRPAGTAWFSGLATAAGSAPTATCPASAGSGAPTQASTSVASPTSGSATTSAPATTAPVPTAPTTAAPVASTPVGTATITRPGQATAAKPKPRPAARTASTARARRTAARRARAARLRRARAAARRHRAAARR